MQRRSKSRRPIKAVRHIVPQHFQLLPTRDGRHSTREVARYPSGDADFLWQVTVSTVMDGHLCSFPGKDRTIGVVQGDGFCLNFQGSEAPKDAIILSEHGALFKFCGDSETQCKLLKPTASGQVVDFSVMTDRALFVHNTRILNLELGQPGVEAFPQQQVGKLGNEKDWFNELPSITSKLVLLSLRGTSKAYFPKIESIGGRMCFCADCLGEGGEEGFKLGEGEALVMEPGNGIAVTAFRDDSVVAAIQIYPNLDMDKVSQLSKM